MAFMEKEIWKGEYYEVEANHGETWIVPVDASGYVDTVGQLNDYVEGTIDNPGHKAETKVGWLGRLSAPGYLDCTEWSAYATEQEAVEDLTEMYGDDEEGD